VPLARFADRAQSILSTGIDAYPPRLEALEKFDEIVSWYGTNRPEFRESVSHLPIRFLDALPCDNKLHAVDFYLRQVGAPLGGVPELPCVRRDDHFIAIHPFSGSINKDWPHFRALDEKLGSRVEFCVGPHQSWPGAVRITDLFELAHWLATSSLYIGNDSGITHLAAAAGVPVIAIFQASDPEVWAPRAKAPVVVLRSPSIDDVLSAARRLLRPSDESP
jgi:heptosyltransferase-3